MSSSNLKNREDFFSVSCGYASGKHKLNLSTREVKQSALDAIEKGCPIETLEELAREFPICKYKTQITIHGLFPKISTHYIGEYHNLVQNKNKSIGVRWTAIDRNKKDRLFEIAKEVSGYSIVSNSSTYHIEKVKRVTKETIKDVLEAFKAEAERLDKSLFSGGADVWTGSVWGVIYAVLEVHVNSFYERDFDKLATNITGLDADQRKAKMDALKAKREAERAKYEAELEARRREAKAKREEELKKLETETPCPFPKVENYTIRPGDVIARAAYKSYHDRSLYWQFYVVSKSFGKIIITPCDAHGQISVDEYGHKSKGRELEKTTGTFHVKQAA